MDRPLNTSLNRYTSSCVLSSSGPWFIGELIHDHVGAMFVYGLYIDGQWIPGSLTFYYGILQVTFIQMCISKSFPLACVPDPVFNHEM